MAQATAPTTANYSLDPTTGSMTSTGAPGMVDVTGAGSSSLGSLAPSTAGGQGGSDPYSLFNGALASMLVKAQNQNTSNNTLLGGAKDALTSLSVAPAGPKPFDPTVFSGNQVAGQQALQSGFQPAVTSISTQMANTASAMTGIENTISGLQTAYQPLVLQPGQSLVSRDGKVLQQGHSYTPQINPLTGLMDGFDQNTGTWASSDSGSAGGGNGGAVTQPPASNADLVGGVDFSGAATSTLPYATDPNYASEVDSMYNQILKVNPLPTAAGLDGFITSQVGGKGNVTGQMIMSAAAQYQVDPNLLAAVLGHESDFGTAGAGAKTMNPGNVGNNGTSTVTMNSWQQGVNAAAKAIAARMPGNPNASNAGAAAAGTNVQGGTSTSSIGGSFSAEAGAKVAQLPKALQGFVSAGPLGVAYINIDQVPDALKQSVQTLASKPNVGIPVVATGDVSAVKAIQTVLSNLDSMETLANSSLSGGGWLGSVGGHAKDLLFGPLNEGLQTEWGQNLGKFDNYRDTAIKAVQALAGGAGSGLRINGAEIEANTQNLPSSTDSQQNAIKQIQLLRQLIYTQMAPSFPYAMVPVVDPNGQTGSLPAGNLDAAIKAGYSVQ